MELFYSASTNVTGQNKYLCKLVSEKYKSRDESHVDLIFPSLNSLNP